MSIIVHKVSARCLPQGRLRANEAAGHLAIIMSNASADWKLPSSDISEHIHCPAERDQCGTDILSRTLSGPSHLLGTHMFGNPIEAEDLVWVIPRRPLNPANIYAQAMWPPSVWVLTMVRDAVAERLREDQGIIFKTFEFSAKSGPSSNLGRPWRWNVGVRRVLASRARGEHPMAETLTSL